MLSSLSSGTLSKLIPEQEHFTLGSLNHEHIIYIYTHIYIYIYIYIYIDYIDIDIHLFLSF